VDFHRRIVLAGLGLEGVASGYWTWSVKPKGGSSAIAVRLCRLLHGHSRNKNIDFALNSRNHRLGLTD
jgi:hypothetical protein